MRTDAVNQWTKFGLEGLLIVISILAAFGVDSWWSDRQQAIEEQQLLGQLKEEFVKNAQLLAERRGTQALIVEAIEKLLVITGPEASNSSIDTGSFNQYVFNASDWFTYDPQLEVLSGLIQSGKLGIIGSDRLRNALAGWPASVRDLGEDEAIARDYSMGRLAEYLASNSPLRDVQRQVLREIPDFIYPDVQASKFPVDIKGLLTDQTFENMLHQKLWLVLSIMSEYKNLAQRIDEILELIDGEMMAPR